MSSHTQRTTTIVAHVSPINETSFPEPAWDVPQLTFRAIVTGIVLGGISSLSNIYTGLKIGWSFNMSITSALLSYGLFRFLGKVKQTALFGMHENAIQQTATSTAASVASAGMEYAYRFSSSDVRWRWRWHATRHSQQNDARKGSNVCPQCCKHRPCDGDSSVLCRVLLYRRSRCLDGIPLRPEVVGQIPCCPRSRSYCRRKPDRYHRGVLLDVGQESTYVCQ